jgi:hypothetical protein
MTFFEVLLTREGLPPESRTDGNAFAEDNNAASQHRKHSDSGAARSIRRHQPSIHRGRSC